MGEQLRQLEVYLLIAAQTVQVAQPVLFKWAGQLWQFEQH